MSQEKPSPCKSCGSIPVVKIGGPGCCWIKCQCGMETTDGTLARVVKIWNAQPTGATHD